MPVKVKLPLAALGIVILPVDEVIRPELLRVVFTVRLLAAIARVPELASSKVSVMMAPPAVKVTAPFKLRSVKVA